MTKKRERLTANAGGDLLKIQQFEKYERDDSPSTLNRSVLSKLSSPRVLIPLIALTISLGVSKCISNTSSEQLTETTSTNYK